MDCENARILLLFYRPGRTTDLAAEDVTALEAHLAECPTCTAAVGRQTMTDRAVGTALRTVVIPAGLKSGLAVSTAVTAAKLWRTKWLARTTATSAAVALAVIGWGGYDRLTRPTLDTYSWADQQERTLLEPEKTVREWLQQQDLPVPSELNLRLASDHGFADVQGVRVPTIRLRADGQTAWVYLLPPGKFSLAKAPDAQNSTITVQLFRDQPVAGWTVMVAYTGNLGVFLKSPA